jgi:hypothetical protein
LAKPRAVNASTIEGVGAITFAAGAWKRRSSA